jgi:flagellar hook-length control protein FliK
VSTTPSAAPAVAAGNPAINAASSTTPAAPAATPGSRDQVGSCGSATPPSLAATDATPPPALATPAIGRAPSPVIEAGTRQSGLGAPTAASVVTRSTPGRGAAVAGGATRDPGPTAASAATAPVATELRTAVAAVPAGEPKADADSNSVPSAAQLADAASASLAPGVAPPERPAPAATAQVQSPVGNPAWAHELADRVTVLVNQNLTHAQIRLAPAELGPIEVRIALADGQANVSFLTHSHVTSEALQAAAPRLREALGSQGYASVNVDVSQQQFRDRTPQQSRYEPEFAVAVAAPTPRAAVRATNASAARLDAYA